MDSSNSATTADRHWVRELNRYHWFVLIVAALWILVERVLMVALARNRTPRRPR